MTLLKYMPPLLGAAVAGLSGLDASIGYVLGIASAFFAATLAAKQ